MAKTYVVKSGDTLSGIAKANNTTVHALMTLNPSIKDKNLIHVGQVITLPGIPETPEKVEPPKKEEPDYTAIGKQVERVISDIADLDSFQLLMEMM